MEEFSPFLQIIISNVLNLAVIGGLITIFYRLGRVQGEFGTQLGHIADQVDKAEASRAEIHKSVSTVKTDIAVLQSKISNGI